MKVAYNLLDGASFVQTDIIRCLCETYPKDINFILRNNPKRSKRFEALPYSPMFFENLDSPPLSWLRQETSLPFFVLDNNIDILYCPDFSAPLRQPCRTVVEAGNIDHLIFRDEKVKGLENRIRSYFRTLSAKKSNRTVVHSSFYKKVLQKSLGLFESRIDVIPCPPGHSFKPVFDASRIQDAAKKLGIGSNYYIYSGSNFKKDNIKELLEIFTGFLAHKSNASLVMTGSCIKSLGSVKDNSALKNRLFLIEPKDDVETSLLYNGATAFVTASLFQSFPFDALNAMACGTPVICYDNSSFTEILENACIPVKNGNGSDFVKAMRESRDNQNLRLKLRALGIQRSKSFSVERSAACLHKVFEAVNREVYLPDEK